MYSRFRLLPAFCVFLSISVLSTEATSAIAGPSASSTEVLYLLEGSTVQTYDVDRQTGNPTQQGSGVTLDATQNIAIATSANDRFLYVTGYVGSTQSLWVYATDSNGVPQLPAVQALRLGSGYSPLSIDPDGTLAYAARNSLNWKYQTVAAIYSFTIDPTTGRVKKSPKPVATYPANGPCNQGADFAGLGVVGFNPKGTAMYDAWGCSYHDAGGQGFYYSRSVSQETGALGAEKLVLYWDNGSDTSTNLVNITPSAIVYFSLPNDYSQGYGDLAALPLSGGTPLVDCTAAMLEACGYATWETVDPSGKYVFFQVSSTTTLVTKLELAKKKIVDTGSYVGGHVWAFSPDDLLVYTEDENLVNPWIYSIYVFDPATGRISYTGRRSGQTCMPTRF
jgi:hypothetical protein